MQLRVDGTEVVHPAPDAVWPARKPPLTDLQRTVLRVADEQGGEIRSVEAGKIVHSYRGHCGFGKRGSNLVRHNAAGEVEVVNGPRAGSIGCCQYAASDGLEVLKRLERRGYVEHSARGRWRVK